MFAPTIASVQPTIRSYMKFNPLKPNIDNFVFKLHYRVTVLILVLATVMVCAKEYFGEHMKCMSDEGVPDHVFKTYCFIMGTFTIVRHYNESLLTHNLIPHPGVGPMTDTEEKLHHKYYQWVPFVLFLQAICFYIPHYIWKKKEGGRIKALVDGLQMASLALSDEEFEVNGTKMLSKSSLEQRLDLIRKDIILRLRITRTWSTWLITMEIANLLHVVFQVWITNVFLNGYFLSIGARLFSGNLDKISDPFETIFPKVTKCTFHKFGPTGNIQNHDALCVMSLNIVYEKIYSVLWFWFLMLFIFSILALVWRLITCCSYRRPIFTKYNAVFFWQPGAVRGRLQDDNKFNPQNVITVVNGCHYGDWLFLYYLAKNMNGFVFQELFRRLAAELQKQEIAAENDFEDNGAQPILMKHSQLSHDDETVKLVREHKYD